MKICTVCGNPIESSARHCPHCEQPQSARSIAHTKPTRPTVITVNLEEGRPLVDEALDRMTRTLYEARIQETKIIRFIHGYGSSGIGGAIQLAVRRQLETAQGNGTIKYYVNGEDYPHSETGRRLRSQFQKMKEHLRTDQRNRGITLAVL